MKFVIQPLPLVMPGRVPEQVPDIGPLIIMAAIIVGLITIGPTIILGVVGGITGGLTWGASGGKGSLIGIGIGMITTVICWIPIGILTFLSELENWHFWRDLVVYVTIPLTILIGIVVTVVLVRRTGD